MGPSVKQQVIYINHTYYETLDLLVEARNYAEYMLYNDTLQSGPYANLRLTYHSFRVTNRLIHVMAWLLAQRAAQAGEISHEHAVGDEFALSGGFVALDPFGAEDNTLPNGLRKLLDRSYKLYMRVARLEKQVRRHCLMQPTTDYASHY